MLEYVQCKVCGQRIPIDTKYQYIECNCGTIAVDGGENYCRIIGEKENWQIVQINKED